MAEHNFYTKSLSSVSLAHLCCDYSKIMPIQNPDSVGHSPRLQVTIRPHLTDSGSLLPDSLASILVSLQSILHTAIGMFFFKSKKSNIITPMLKILQRSWEKSKHPRPTGLNSLASTTSPPSSPTTVLLCCPARVLVTLWVLEAPAFDLGKGLRCGHCSRIHCQLVGLTVKTLTLNIRI